MEVGAIIDIGPFHIDDEGDRPSISAPSISMMKGTVIDIFAFIIDDGERHHRYPRFHHR
jgi:hypothetical protein